MDPSSKTIDYEALLQDPDHPGWQDVQAKTPDVATLVAWIKSGREQGPDQQQALKWPKLKTGPIFIPVPVGPFVVPVQVG